MEKEISLPLPEDKSQAVKEQRDPSSTAQSTHSDKTNSSSHNQGTQLLGANYVSNNSNKPVAMVEPVQQQQREEVASPTPPDNDIENVVEVRQKPKAKFDLVAELKKGCILT